MPRAGFLVPNATDVAGDLDISEPDAGDFNLLGNHRFGVINGCDITITGTNTTVNISAGVYIVNSVLVVGNGGSAPLSIPVTNPRFDLIVGNSAGVVSAILGTESANPVFPPYDTTVCIFAAVLSKPGTSILQAVDVTDKRIMAHRTLLAARTNAEGPLIRNIDPSTKATQFQVNPDGHMLWDGDNSFLERDAANGNGVHIGANLRVDGGITAATIGLTGDLAVGGKIRASNFREGSGAPTGTANNGDLYKDTATGNIWAYQGGTWAQMSTVPIPAGMIMPTMLSTQPQGWLLLNGQTVSQAASGGLWTLFPQWQSGGNMVLPDATGCFLGWGTPGVKGGQPSNMVTLTVANLPAHHHLQSPTASAGGAHTHAASEDTQGGHSHVTGVDGAHGHNVNDPQHAHPPWKPNAYIISGMPPGQGAEGYALGTRDVTDAPYTGLAATGITVDGGAHQHSTDIQGPHAHNITIVSGGSAHTHPITENDVGTSTPFDVRPPFLGVYYLIKT